MCIVLERPINDVSIQVGVSVRFKLFKAEIFHDVNHTKVASDRFLSGCESEQCTISLAIRK